MDSRVKLFGHSLHQILIVLPLGSFGMAILFDVIHVLWNNPTMAIVAYWLIVAGVIAALVAAPFGFIDWLAIPKGTRAKSIGGLHGVGNLVVVALFIGSWALRADVPEAPGATAFALSLAGAALVAVTGWLGGELVDRLGVGVYDDANLNAPSSLRRGASR